MKRAILSQSAIALFAACIAVSAQAADMPGVEFSDALAIKARVAGVDRQDRVLWVQGPEGNVVVLEVSDAVENFKQIRVDDQLALEYYEAVALYIGGKGEPPEADAGEVLATAPKGMEPGGTRVETVHVAAIIEAIDTAKRTLTLKGPEGNVIPLKVPKSVTAFDKLQVGDAVNASYAEAFAISVNKP
jgi:hypothetical protein